MYKLDVLGVFSGGAWGVDMDRRYVDEVMRKEPDRVERKQKVVDAHAGTEDTTCGSSSISWGYVHPTNQCFLLFFRRTWSVACYLFL